MKKSEFFSLLHASGASTTGGKPDTSATQMFTQMKFAANSADKTVCESCTPSPMVLMTMEVNMVTDEAGTFTLYSRREETPWKEILEGRVTGVEVLEGSCTRKFRCVGGDFSRLTLLTSQQPVAEKLHQVPWKNLLTDLGVRGSKEKVEEINIKNIRRCATQPRVVFGPGVLQELCNSIREHGLLKAIVVRKLGQKEIGPDGCEYELLGGERRWICHQKLGLKLIRTIIRESRGTRADFTYSFVDNLHAAKHNPYEICLAVHRYHNEWGLDAAAIYRETGLNLGAVTQYLGLLPLAPDLIEKLNPTHGDAHRLRIGHATKLATIPDHGKQRELYKEAYSHHQDGYRAVNRRFNQLLLKSSSVLVKVRSHKDLRMSTARAVQALVADVVLVDDLWPGFSFYVNRMLSESDRRELSATIKRCEGTLARMKGVLSTAAPAVALQGEE